MGGFVRYLQLQAKAKTGLSIGLLIWAAIAVLGVVAALLFLLLAAFVWLTTRFGALFAALIMAGACLLIAVIAALISYASRSSAITEARLALAERKHQPWLNPALLSVGLQAGKQVGWGRLLSLAAAVVLAAGIGREWLGGQDKPDQKDRSDSSDD
jgi:hypothetical protein